jgi:hypothetical protein
METVEQRLEGFVATVQINLIAYYQKVYSRLAYPTISVDAGSKFYRIVSTGALQRSAYCFVNKTNGDILKAASWKTPAKHVRGNIFDANYGWGKAVIEYGARYMR